MTPTDPLRGQLLELLDGGHAHMSLDQAVADFPMDHVSDRVPNGSYSVWALLEHIRRSQKDILRFIVDPDYVSPAWPKGYWPEADEEATPEKWQLTLTEYRQDLRALRDIVKDPEADLESDLPHAPGYSILREVLVVSDHAAYHIGEFAILRQVLGTWPNGRQA